MLNYTSERWTEGTSAPGRHTALLFSRAARFDFLTRSKRALAVRRASFDNSSISLLGVTSSGHQIELTDEDSMTLMFPVRGRLEVVHDRRLLVERDGGLLITCDSVQHWEPSNLMSFMAKAVTGVMGFKKPAQIGPPWRKVNTPEGSSLKPDFERIAQLPFDKLIGGHGGLAASGAQALLKASIAREF